MIKQIEFFARARGGGVWGGEVPQDQGGICGQDHQVKELAEHKLMPMAWHCKEIPHTEGVLRDIYQTARKPS